MLKGLPTLQLSWLLLVEENPISHLSNSTFLSQSGLSLSEFVLVVMILQYMTYHLLFHLIENDKKVST